MGAWNAARADDRRGSMTSSGDRPRWWQQARRRAGSRSFVSRSVRHAVTLLALGLVIEYLVLPQLAGAGKSLHVLSRVHLGYAAAGVLLEAAALLAYSQLTRAVLPHGAPSRFTILRINMSTLAVSHVLPAGTAGGTPVGLRLMTESGVSGADATFAVATQGIGSAVVLNVLLWIALVISIPLRGFNPLYAVAALVGVLLMAAVAALVLLFTRGEDRAAAWRICRYGSSPPRRAAAGPRSSRSWRRRPNARPRTAASGPPVTGFAHPTATRTPRPPGTSRRSRQAAIPPRGTPQPSDGPPGRGV